MTQSRASALASFDQFLAAGGFRSYLAGLTLSTGGGSVLFSVGAGVAMDSTNADLMALTSAISKNCSTAWASGSGNGSLDTGTLSASTWYHTHLIYNPTSGAVDVLTSLSATAPTLPSGYTLFRRIGSMKTDPTPVLLKFTQVGDEFLWSTPVADVTSATTSTTAAAKTLSVPQGVNVWAKGTANLTVTSSGSFISFYPLDMGTQVSNTPAGYITMDANLANSALYQDMTLRTNTSGQIGVVAGNSSGTYGWVTYGWIDRRGRDA